MILLSILGKSVKEKVCEMGRKVSRKAIIYPAAGRQTHHGAFVLLIWESRISAQTCNTAPRPSNLCVNATSYLYKTMGSPPVDLKG